MRNLSYHISQCPSPPPPAGAGACVAHERSIVMLLVLQNDLGYITARTTHSVVKPSRVVSRVVTATLATASFATMMLTMMMVKVRSQHMNRTVGLLHVFPTSIHRSQRTG